MIGAMLINVVLKAQRTVAECTTASCLSARTVLPWAAFAAAVAVALAASRLFGPVLASAAEGFWLLDAPISRAKLLRRPTGRRGGDRHRVGGLVIGALVSALTGSGLTGVLVWAGATGLSAAASVAFAAAQQGAERHRLTHAATYVFGLLGGAGPGGGGGHLGRLVQLQSGQRPGRRTRPGDDRLLRAGAGVEPGAGPAPAGSASGALGCSAAARWSAASPGPSSRWTSVWPATSWSSAGQSIGATSCPSGARASGWRR